MIYINLPKKIFLVGMPGSGKSTMGKQLADQFERNFFDLDQEIENMLGSSVTDIFAEEGEEGFREAERDVLYMLVRLNEPAVIATGGGAPCFHDGINVMNKSGHTVFINPPMQTIIERVSQEKGLRPLVDEMDDAIDTKLVELYEQRLPFYQQAKFELNSNDMEALVKHLQTI